MLLQLYYLPSYGTDAHLSTVLCMSVETDVKVSVIVQRYCQQLERDVDRKHCWDERKWEVWTLDEWQKEKTMHQEMLVSHVAFGLFAFQRAEKRA